MSRTSKALKRLGVAGVAVATIGAGVPAFFASAAQAAPTAVTLSPDAQTTPEDTCQQYTATVTFDNTTGVDTATVDVTADPRATEDVEFCELSTTTASSPKGTSTNLPHAGTQAYPTGNTNGTTTTFRSGGASGITENREFTVQSTPGSNTGTVTFGVVSDRAGTVDITAFLENTNASIGNGQKDPGEPGDTSVGTYTLGGTEGVERVDAEPESGAATQGQAYTFTAQLFNAATGGQPIAGVTPVFTVISGPDANINITTACNAASDQNGLTTCTLNNGGATPGSDTIRVFVNQNDPDNNPATNDATALFNTGEPFDDITVAFSSPQAAGTTLTLTCASVRTNLAGDACDNPITENSEVFTALVKNAAGTPLSGVPVRFSYAENGGSDAAVVPDDAESITPQCTTGADGTCTATLSNPRVYFPNAPAPANGGEQFLVTAAVEVSSGSGNCAGINNVANNSVCDTATKRFRTPDDTEARILTLTPETQTVPAQGGVARVTATVVDRSGIAVPNVTVFFTEDGTGRFFAANSANTAACTTGTNGTCAVELSTTTAEGAGSTNITATIANNPGANNEECEQTANNTGPYGGANNTGNNQPGAPAGDCDDTAVVNFTASSSPTATPTATTSPGCKIVTTTVNTKTVNATGLASVTVSGATAGSTVELQGYSQNHYGTANFGNDTTNPDRTGVANSAGSVTFNDLRPGSNTRLRARQVGCGYGNSDVINVRTQLSLQVTRTAPRTYRFNVDSIPARPGGLIVSIYRITGSPCAAGVEPRNCPGEVFVGQTRVSSTNGAGSVTLTFGSDYPAREQFVLKTGQDAQNAPGRSNVRDLAIF